MSDAARGRPFKLTTAPQARPPRSTVRRAVRCSSTLATPRRTRAPTPIAPCRLAAAAAVHARRRSATATASLRISNAPARGSPSLSAEPNGASRWDRRPQDTPAAFCLPWTAQAQKEGGPAEQKKGRDLAEHAWLSACPAKQLPSSRPRQCAASTPFWRGAESGRQGRLLRSGAPVCGPPAPRHVSALSCNHDGAGTGSRPKRHQARRLWDRSGRTGGACHGSCSRLSKQGRRG
eukprot:119278-Chlamydomonas_euryale.AAC.2